MKVIIEKECEICGTRFQTTNTLRKYCDDCQKHTERNRKEVEKGIRHIAEITRQPNIVDVECEECGKHFKTIPSLFIKFETDDGKSHLFCSEKCRENFIKFHGTCCHCGKKFDGNYLFVAGSALYGRYCSHECHESRKEQYIKENWTKCRCEHCGKEFYKKKSQKFCSKDCYNAALESGWKPVRAKKTEDPNLVLVRRKCVICGKFVEKKLYPQDVNRYVFLCSDECSVAYRKQEREKSKKFQKEQKLKKEKEHLEKANFALCATCKVPYKECSYMASNYVVLPAGAHMDSTGKIVRCPLHR